MSENQWWDDLEGDEINNNAYGVPHYDADAVADFIETHIDFTTLVLDLGCGPGRLGHLLARRNPECVVKGIDVSSQMVRLSLINAPGNWLAQSNNGNTIPVMALSGAYSVTVFQHVPHAVSAGYVRQVYDRLSAGGRFLFTYAFGDEDTFLSHQASHSTALSWLTGAGFRNAQTLDTPDTHPAWNWAVGTK